MRFRKIVYNTKDPYSVVKASAIRERKLLKPAAVGEQVLTYGLVLGDVPWAELCANGRCDILLWFSQFEAPTPGALIPPDNFKPRMVS